MSNEYTSERIASIAGRVLRDPLATEDSKALAASALTQAPDKVEKGAVTDTERLEFLFKVLFGEGLESDVLTLLIAKELQSGKRDREAIDAVMRGTKVK